MHRIQFIAALCFIVFYFRIYDFANTEVRSSDSVCSGVNIQKSGITIPYVRTITYRLRKSQVYSFIQLYKFQSIND